MNQDSSPKPDRLITRRPSRRTKRQRKARVLALAGVGLAVAAVVLIISYVNQTNQTRAEQEALRALYHSAAPSGTPEVLAAALTNPPAPASEAPALPARRTLIIAPQWQSASCR